MSAPVDVLAVMHELPIRGYLDPSTVRSLREARTAVAELIAEAQAVLDHVEDETVERRGGQCTLCHSYRARLRAAIKQVQP